MEKNTAFGTLLASIGAGMALMYFLDPNRGGRRRALVSDKVYSAANRLPDAINVTTEDLSNRAYGLWAEATRLFSSDNPSDQVIEARVRSKMGRVVSHPHAIGVTARDGVITLSGPILTEEVPYLLACVNRVSGVNEVVNNLEPHATADNHPALQGGREREGSRFEFMQENWSPAARFIAGAVGASLAAYGGTRRSALGAGLGTAGLLLLARGVTNTGFSQLWHLGSSEGNGAIEENRTRQPSAIRA